MKYTNKAAVLIMLLVFINITHAKNVMQNIRNIVKVHIADQQKVIAIFDSLRTIKFADEFIFYKAQSEMYVALAMYALFIEYGKRAMESDLLKNEKFRSTIQMNNIYATEQQKKVIGTQRLWLFIFGLLFLSTLCFSTIMLVNHGREKWRNERRFREIMAQNSMRNNENHDHQVDKLFSHLEELMEVQKLYLNPNLERNSLCRALNTNVTYLAAAIKQKTNQTILGYIHTVRLDCAKKLISESTKLDIEQVAIDSGFGSSRTLYRQFKASFNLTPLEFFKLSVMVRD